jgi:hypothetical protein
LNQWRTLALRLQVWDSGSSLIACVCEPRMACFCKESFECLPGFFSSDSFSPAVTIVVSPVITGITKLFMFYIRWISVLKFLYLSLFSAPFSIMFVSDGVATSNSKQFLSSVF